MVAPWCSCGIPVARHGRCPATLRPGAPSGTRVPLRSPERSPCVVWFVPARGKADDAGQERRPDTRPGRGPGRHGPAPARASSQGHRAAVMVSVQRRGPTAWRVPQRRGSGRPPPGRRDGRGRTPPPVSLRPPSSVLHPPSSVLAPPRARAGRSTARAPGQGGLPARGRAHGGPGPGRGRPARIAHPVETPRLRIPPRGVSDHCACLWWGTTVRSRHALPGAGGTTTR